MPNRDGTGPNGNGPNTGRGLGPCGDQPQNNSNNNKAPQNGQGNGAGQRPTNGRGQKLGRGQRQGRGQGRKPRGRGYRCRRW